MALKDLIKASNIYYNDKLAAEYLKSDNRLGILVGNRTKKKNPISNDNAAERLGIDLKNPIMVEGTSMSLEECLKVGEEVILDIFGKEQCFKMDTEQVMTYIRVAQDSHAPVSGFSTPYDWALCQLSEMAMRLIFEREGKQIRHRGNLYHTLESERQKEKDFWVATAEGKKELGVKCHRSFSENYLYGWNRIKDQPADIAPHVVLFDHLCHHIFYITGIVEKEFLTSRKVSQSPYEKGMEPFMRPEFMEVLVLENYSNGLGIDSSAPLAEKEQKVLDVLRKRIPFGALMDKVLFTSPHLANMAVQAFFENQGKK